MNTRGGLSQTAKLILSVLGVVALSALGGFYIFYFGPIFLTTLKPVQPIAFSHKIHAADFKIPCQYCHTFARRSEMAGAPSAHRCMNCHEFAGTDKPEVMKITDYVENGKPIMWERVFDLPDHVWFSHKRHIKKGFKCQECHGPIETMDVVERANEFKMGFCLGCHQKNEAPTDCWTCHT